MTRNVDGPRAKYSEPWRIEPGMPRTQSLSERLPEPGRQRNTNPGEDAWTAEDARHDFDEFLQSVRKSARDWLELWKLPPIERAYAVQRQALQTQREYLKGCLRLTDHMLEYVEHRVGGIRTGRAARERSVSADGSVHKINIGDRDGLQAGKPTRIELSNAGD